MINTVNLSWSLCAALFLIQTLLYFKPYSHFPVSARAFSACESLHKEQTKMASWEIESKQGESEQATAKTTTAT